MVAAATAFASAISLSSALLPSQGGSTRSLPWKKKERPCIRKSGPGMITAKFELKPPPYDLKALEPHMSSETMEYHWGRHHRTYVENLNKQIEGTEMDGMTLEDVILATYNKGDLLPAFNNAAQAWNHDFFWESMKPDGGGKPSGELLKLINRDFGSLEGFIREFKAAAATQFGSGWAWLVYKANRLDVGNAINPFPKEEDKKLVVVKSHNAVNPPCLGLFTTAYYRCLGACLLPRLPEPTARLYIDLYGEACVVGRGQFQTRKSTGPSC
ncbi:hypothetical protein Vadar_032208 [Vaccinium darrowii]|uniref:Uncharacterized protein n=1 Tax=Vaccinium darrowii TaxID=229202 RepID=A0ACB7YRB7_9ERIC|nr:hypothetical protein Vadar_032208 [Vaccinium darrowii]